VPRPSCIPISYRTKNGFNLARLGLLGGTFDPIHIGHLALARTAIDALHLDQLMFIPSGQPWQKTRTITPAKHRLQMLNLALAPWLSANNNGQALMGIDALETRREGPSYTIDTLIEISQRDENGAKSNNSLILVLGSDQFRNLATWHRWEELLNYCHIAVTQRETISLSDLPEPVEQLLQRHGCQTLPEKTAGSIVFFSMPPVAVSSTALRRSLQLHEDVTTLVPPTVLQYIQQNKLYNS
jgi:nicotinate-nucleotide adenylyltransferase